MDNKREDTIVFYDRTNKVLCEEIVMGKGLILWAYKTMAGKIFSKFIFGNKLLSSLLGIYFDSSLSKSQIKKTIMNLKIDESEFLKKTSKFKSFNDFFTRKLKPEARPFSKDMLDIVSPADGRVLVYPDATQDSLIDIKGLKDKIENFIGDDVTGFEACSVVVVRLCPADYHRYHFPCNGVIIKNKSLPGAYHSVNPFALNVEENIFCKNKREYTLCSSDKGDFIYAEVGAFGVSGIVQTYEKQAFAKMDEKGYFKFGGSTVVLIFPKGMVTFSEDLIECSAKGVETLVKVGETIGRFK